MDHRLFDLIREDSRHIRVNEARSNHVDRDAARSEFLGCRLREAEHASLRCSVVRLAGIAHETDNRAHVDDAAAALLHHDLRSCLRTVEYALEVRIDDRIEIFFFHANQKSVTRDAGVVDEDVNRAERLDNFCKHFFYCSTVCHIGLHEDCLAAILLDLALDFLRCLLVASEVDGNLGTLRSEADSNGTADTARRTRYECDLPI